MKERSLAAWFKEQALPWIVGLGFLAIVLGFIIGLASCTTTQKLPDPNISPSPVPSFSPAPGGKARLPSMQTYLTYYGSWNQWALDTAKKFPLIIAKQGTTASQVAVLKERGAKVVLYVSVGEHDTETRERGDGQGPVKCDGDKRVLLKKGVASFYAQNKRGNDKEGYSWYTDAGNPAWQAMVLAEASSLIDKGADGLFLDTIDTAAPYSDGAGCTAQGMLDLVLKLRAAFPSKYIIANRGLFYFDPSKSTYSDAYRQAVSGIMFENFYTSWEDERGVKSEYWSGHLDAAKNMLRESAKSDGFTPLFLDYFAPDQLPNSDLFKQQKAEIAKFPGAVNSVNDIHLGRIYTTLLEGSAR